MNVIDLFCGARGWEASPDCPVNGALGIELDPTACATSRAAGFDTEQADIARLSPHTFGKVDGLIASPPCQTFSMAGKGNGRRDLQAVLGLVPFVAAGWSTTDADDRTWLVLEPLRWAVELRPDWIALEQVPPVLPIWEAIATELRKDGYHVAVGLLHAEQYGVPQTRKRAVLLAARWPVALPVPTHSRYYPRNPAKLDPGVLPWTSMAAGLDWGKSVGWVQRERSGGRCHEGFDPRCEPAQTLTSKARSWSLHAFPTPAGVYASVDAARLSAEDAGLLQSFPAHHPWQGTRTRQFEQIANAIPPGLASACFEALGLAQAQDRAA